MGVNVNVKLPAGARMRDVATVAGVLLGCKKSWQVSQDSKARWVIVEGVKQKTSSIPEMAYIDINVAFIDNPAAKAIHESDGDTYQLSYHFEGEHNGPLLNPKSTAAKIALCKAVVMFFGGECDYNNSDAVDMNLRVSPRVPIAAHDGKPWDDFQLALDAIKPLTAQDIERGRRWAAYKEDC